MGLFDDLRCDYPLPGVEPGRWYQTKSFPDPYMEKYVITEAGNLLKQRVHYEDRSDPNAQPGSVESICGITTPVEEGWDAYALTGDVSFYDGDAEFTVHFHGGTVACVHAGDSHA